MDPCPWGLYPAAKKAIGVGASASAVWYDPPDAHFIFQRKRAGMLCAEPGRDCRRGLRTQTQPSVTETDRARYSAVIGHHLTTRPSQGRTWQYSPVREKVYAMAITSKWTESSSDKLATLSRSERVSEHTVQFYETDDFLTDGLSEFIGAGLGAGEACVVIGTSAHRAGLEQRLQARGFEMSAVRERGDYVALDAAETLAKLLVAGIPDERRFEEVIGGVIKRAAQAPRGQRGRRRHVRAFGEMVALLWAQGELDAAVRLEDLWNDLQHRASSPSFSLLCAYPMSTLAGAGNSTMFAEVCALHSNVPLMRVTAR